MKTKRHYSNKTVKLGNGSRLVYKTGTRTEVTLRHVWETGYQDVVMPRSTWEAMGDEPPNQTADREQETTGTLGQSSFWIQKKAPAGNWVDYLGLDPSTVGSDAESILNDTAEAFHDECFRLIVRTDTPLKNA